jgi:hypothetical protein
VRQHLERCVYAHLQRCIGALAHLLPQRPTHAAQLAYYPERREKSNGQGGDAVTDMYLIYRLLLGPWAVGVDLSI